MYKWLWLVNVYFLKLFAHIFANEIHSNVFLIFYLLWLQICLDMILPVDRVLVIQYKKIFHDNLILLENPMDGGAWWATVHGVAESWTWLRDFTFTFHSYALEKEMTTHSSILALRIPGTGEPGGLPSLGSHRVGHDWSDLAAAAPDLEAVILKGDLAILSMKCHFNTIICESW